MSLYIIISTEWFYDYGSLDIITYFVVHVCNNID